MRKILIWLGVIQEREYINRSNGEVHPSYIQKRLNPNNPLTYITISLILLAALFLYGILGLWENLPKENPFSWK